MFKKPFRNKFRLKRRFFICKWFLKSFVGGIEKLRFYFKAIKVAAAAWNNSLEKQNLRSFFSTTFCLISVKT